MDSNVVYVESVEQEDNNALPVQLDQNRGFEANRMQNTGFRDMVCLIMASLICNPVCPCLFWMSLKTNQDATEAYWRGDYQNANKKQSCAIKWCIAQVLVGIVFLIIAFIVAGSSLFDAVPVENGSE